MKRFNLRQNKLLFCETIFVIAVIIIAICLILYSSLFSIFNDLRRQNYDETYLLEIYQKEKSNLTNLVLLIKNNDIETISHGIMIDKTQNYYYLDSLYYQTDSNLTKSKLKSISSYAYDIFDKYDFDVIENDDNSITFTYLSAGFELTYLKYDNRWLIDNFD